jgi:FKBP-type peptidyl-prolyl cis-trans isomerase SlyD
MSIKENDVVSMHYTLSDADGQVLDSSIDGEVMNFLQGHGNIIPGLEKAMLGKSIGDTFDAVIAPGDGYGEVHAELIQEVPLEAFEGVDNIEAGMRFQAETAQGPVPVVITAIKDGVAIVDGNHELAGQTLYFSVEIIDIREAAAEEIDHGHVH